MVARSLFFSAFVHRVCNDPARTIEVTGEAIAIADRYGLPFSKAWAGMFLGWAKGDVGLLGGILETNRARGEVVCRPFLLSMLAEAEAARGQIDLAQGHLDEALRFAEEQADVMFLGGVLRQNAALLLTRDPEALEPAEACLRRALEVAQGQRARTEELGAAVELYRVLQRRGRQREGHDLLALVYGAFTEGLETQPLREARSLLGEPGRHEGSFATA
jgi:predicted ATPase